MTDVFSLFLITLGIFSTSFIITQVYFLIDPKIVVKSDHNKNAKHNNNCNRD